MQMNFSKDPNNATGPDFNVLFIGAGGIVFGNDNVRWNHSVRLEAKLGRRLRVLGIVDPSRDRFEHVMSQKRVSPAAERYLSTRNFVNVQEAKEYLGPDVRIHLIILASPPNFRGTMQPGKDLELQLIDSFGTTPAIFCEKPVSASSVAEAKLVSAELARAGNNVGVGYMLRYLKVVQKALQIIRQNNLAVMNLSARYICAYQRIRKFDWWDKEKQCGPIVEQATHFCDLCRYLGGEVVMDSVQAISLEYYEEAGQLSHKHPAITEWKVPEQNRIPRATTAFWKYENGGLGCLQHVIALHGISYSNEIDIVADGYQLRLVDLYIAPRLFVRFPHDEHEEEFYYPGDDPFTNEISAAVNEADDAAGANGVNGTVAEEKDLDTLCTERMLSSYDDAVKTYEFSWKIRTKSEESRVPHPSWAG